MVACRVVAKEDGWLFVLTFLGHVRSASEDSFVPVESNLTEVGDLTVASQRSMSVGNLVEPRSSSCAWAGPATCPCDPTTSDSTVRLQAPEKGVSSNRNCGPCSPNDILTKPRRTIGPKQVALLLAYWVMRKMQCRGMERIVTTTGTLVEYNIAGNDQNKILGNENKNLFPTAASGTVVIQPRNSSTPTASLRSCARDPAH